MCSAKSTIRLISSLSGMFLLVISSLPAFSQENSPFSRYGLGDIVPENHIANRSMGGISAAYSDFQSINTSNPASFSNITSTLFDFGSEIDVRALKSNTSTDKYQSANTIISYLQLGLPLSTKKMLKKGNACGLAFGLRPVTRINYKIENNSRLSGIDSLNTQYEGSGGLSQVFLGTGFKFKKLRVGFSAAYNFGTRDLSTRLKFINDTVIYYKSSTEMQTVFNGLSFSGGLMYDIHIAKSNLRLGVYGNVFNALKASGTDLNQTFVFDGNGAVVPIDTVSINTDQKGTVDLPSTFAGGFTWSNKHWLMGADMEFSNWSDYRFYGEKDATQDIWKLRAGVQYYPASENTPTSKYFQFVKYRLGFYYGPDYINLGESRNEYSITMGAGFPLTSFQLLRRGDFVMLHTGIELGSRGNKNSQSLRENILRFSFGISMNARWFQKPKYD